MSLDTKEETGNNEFTKPSSKAEPIMSETPSPRPSELINSRPRSSLSTRPNPISNVTTTHNDRFHDAIFLGRLRAQVEFYFSTSNLSRDLYLRSLLASYGGTAVPLTVICGFPKVRKLCSYSNDLRRVIPADPLLIHKAVERSSIVMTSPDAVWISPLIPLPPLDPSVTNSAKPISMNLDRLIRDPVQMRMGKIAPKEEDVNRREGSERSSTTRSTVLLRDIPSHYSPESIIKSFTVNNIVPTSVRPDVGNTWYVTFKKEDDAISAVSATRNQTIDGLPIKARIKSEMVLPVSKRSESSSNNNPHLSPTHRPSQNPAQSYPNTRSNGVPAPPGGHHYPPYPMTSSIPVPFTYPPTYPHLPHSTHTPHPHNHPTAGSSPGHTTYPSPPYYYTSPHPPHVPPPHISSKSSVSNHPPYAASPLPTLYGTYITTQPCGRAGYYNIESSFGPPSRNSLNTLNEPHYGRNRSRNITKRTIDPKRNSKKTKGRGEYYPTRELSISSTDMNPTPLFSPGPNVKTPIPYNESQALSTNESTILDRTDTHPPCEGSRIYKETSSNGSMSEQWSTHMRPEKESETSHSDILTHHSYSDLSVQDPSNNNNNRNVNKTLHSFNKKNKKKTKPRRQEFDGRNGSKSLLSFLIDEKEESKCEKSKVMSTWNQDSFPALFSNKIKETDTLTTSVSTKFTGYADALRQTHPLSSSPRRVSIVEATSSSHNLKSNDNEKNRRACVSEDQILEEIIPILNSLELDKSNPSSNNSLLYNPSFNVELKKSILSETTYGYRPKCVEKINKIPSSQVCTSSSRDNFHANDKAFLLTKDPTTVCHAKPTTINLSAVQSIDVTTISKNASSQKLSFSDAVRRQT